MIMMIIINACFKWFEEDIQKMYNESRDKNALKFYYK